MSINVNEIGVANRLNEEIIKEDVEFKPIVKHNSRARRMAYSVVKRIIDIIVGLIGTVILIPLTLIVYISRVVNHENDGPVFYKHLRIGKNGKHFELYKYRSMIIGADKILKTYLDEHEDAKREFEENHKLDNDPRITKFGNFLRKTSLDEFPQFFNVLIGNMSLIGPRPIVDDEIEKYGENKDKLLSVKPGITGYWAAYGRSNTSYNRRIKQELYYVDNFSFKLDAKIFFKTISAVCKREGAK